MIQAGVEVAPMLSPLALLVLPIHFPMLVRVRGGAARRLGLSQRLQLAQPGPLAGMARPEEPRVLLTGWHARLFASNPR